VSQKSVTEGS